MKRLLLLIVILILNSSAHSQTDTSKVKISAENARKALKELAAYDSCKEEIKNLEKQKSLLVSDTVRLTDQVYSLLGEKEIFKIQINMKDQKISNKDQQYKNLESLYKQKNKENEWWKWGGISAFGILVVKMIFSL